MNSDVGKRIKQLLTSYVSVEVTNGGSKWIDSEILGHYFHKHVDKDGGVHYLSGYYYDTNLAKGQMNFLKDCGVESVKLVEVKPTIVENLSHLRNLLRGPDFATLLNSVQPIITKARPSDENFDIECK